MPKTTDAAEIKMASGPSGDEIAAALAVQRIAVGVSAYPLMHANDTIAGLAFKFLLQDGSASILVMPREVCENICEIVEDLSRLGWTTHEMVGIRGLEPR